MYKPAPMLPTREELISVRRAEARALLKAAYQLQSNTTATAPNRIIGAANDLIGALHIVGRPNAVIEISKNGHSATRHSTCHAKSDTSHFLRREIRHFVFPKARNRTL